MVKIVESDKEFDQLLQDAAGKLVVVDFFAEWCGPCKMIAPKLEQMAADNPGVVFLKVDVDKLQSLASNHGITAMPTILFFKGGSEVAKVVGANLSQIQAYVAEHK